MAVTAGDGRLNLSVPSFWVSDRRERQFHRSVHSPDAPGEAAVPAAVSLAVAPETPALGDPFDLVGSRREAT